MGLDIALSRCAPERPCYPLREGNHYHSLRKGIGTHSQGCYGDEKTVILFVFYSLTNASPRRIKCGDYLSAHSFLILYFEHFKLSLQSCYLILSHGHFVSLLRHLQNS